jgi:methanogenic corrinoid protein MtbC1
LSAVAAPGASDEQVLFDQLVAGQRQVVRALLQSWYLEGRSLAEILDGPVRAAMHHVGQLWNHDARGILVEHQATEICLEAIGALRALVPVADDKAPVAIGGAPQGDPYQVPSRMAALVLAEIGFREVNFGAGTPVELMASEAVAREARLVWLSISTKLDELAMRPAIRALADTLQAHQIALVIGGRHRHEYAPADMPDVKLIDSMAELADIAKQIRDGGAHGRANEVASPPATRR